MNKIIILFLGYLLVGLCGILIQLIMNKFVKYNPIVRLNRSRKRMSMFIGIFERILVFTFVLTNQYAAIPIIFAAKSIARFKDLDDRDIAEYYLFGTLMSMTIALIVGVTFRLYFGDVKI